MRSPRLGSRHSIASVTLLERGLDLEAIDRAAVAAGEGRGSVVLIEGVAGIGKSALLRHAVTAERLHTLRARGGEQERGLAFGLARQLVERELPDRGAVFAGDEFVVIHRLYSAVADLAERAPVLLAVDDAQWSDLPSLRWLSYLARRVEALPVLVLVAVREGEPGAPRALLDELRDVPDAIRLRPAPLSLDASATLVREHLDASAAPAFCEACHHASGGNPLLLTELLRAVASEGLEPDAEAALRVVEVGAGGLARQLGRRIARAHPGAPEVARAVAILEPHAEIGAVAELAGLDADDAARAGDSLVKAGVLADEVPLRFAHPLLRAAVDRELSAPERERRHARAAEVLCARGAAAEILATHLMRTRAAVGAWVMQSLETAAEAALAASGPAEAADFLRRAAAEPLAPGDRTRVERRLGQALLRAGDASGIDGLIALRDRSPDPAERADLTAEIVPALGIRGRAAEIEPLLRQSAAELDPAQEPGRFALMTAGPIHAATYDELAGLHDKVAHARELLRNIDEESMPIWLVRQSVATWLSLSGLATAHEAAELALAAIGDEHQLRAAGASGVPMFPAITTVAMCGDTERALRLHDISMSTQRRRGALYGIALAHADRAGILLARGDLADAEEEATLGLTLAERTGVSSVVALVAAALVAVARERGAIEAAERAVSRPQPGTTLHDLTFTAERGLLALVRADAEDASRTLEAVVQARDGLGGWTASLLPTRLMLPIALHAARRPQDAERAAHDSLRFAERAQHPRWTGVAQWVLGRVDPQAGLDALRDSVATLTQTDARLDHARALVDLGSALRRDNARQAARQPLREGMELARRLGAYGLAEHAREELAASGARLRREALSGVESLTPSERRVARLAASGLTNREIAEALFVSRKTVETHLAHVYQKLDTSDRRALATLLDAIGEVASA
jgi:DNA-binding CsgD family transcriptional regulator